MDMFLTVEEKHCDPVDRSSLGGGTTVQQESRFDERKVRCRDPPTHYNLLSVYSRLPEDCL